MEKDVTNTKTVADKVTAKAVVVVVEEDVNGCAPSHTSTVGSMVGVHTVETSARKADGHMDAATAANTQGVSTTNCAWLNS